ncbi:protein-disulfide reductase DsbD domain-containing protein [Ancylobacter amanitiformis]|uniref:DsbC/DsbD-like thiol-disulfide interchange protein n=1 Tax=Ancylobacter amanitiformis TaxID=217069 RepID=A0ABU0LNK8_9HYPH|nr:protein-disulfide reductase DsbD domain-containing protein [Ancylobacter amanitiformis]MDQ0510290.1 DsbC/DsbD-like thiol-disulfide interchange protein [Ancylobacter amanitiformis]
MTALPGAVPARADSAPVVGSGDISSPWTAPNGTAVRLLAGPRDGEIVTGGVQIRLGAGWKTYWRYPGDSGVPPHFDWSGSDNVARVDILWPAPVRFDDGGSFSIGYKKDVTLPFRVTPRDPGKPVDLRLTLDFAVCAKICQPATAEVALALPADGAPSTPPDLAAALSTVPQLAAFGNGGATALETADLGPAAGQPGQTIRVVARVANPDTADLFVEGPSEDWALPLPAREPGPDGQTVFLLPVDGVPKGADIAATRLRFTLVDGPRAVEVDALLSAR